MLAIGIRYLTGYAVATHVDSRDAASGRRIRLASSWRWLPRILKRVKIPT